VERGLRSSRGVPMLRATTDVSPTRIKSDVTTSEKWRNRLSLYPRVSLLTPSASIAAVLNHIAVFILRARKDHSMNTSILRSNNATTRVYGIAAGVAGAFVGLAPGARPKFAALPKRLYSFGAPRPH
jgi:hypothetical protein